MNKTDLNKLKEIEEFFKRLNIYDESFFNEVIYKARIVDYKGLTFNKKTMLKIDGDNYELILPSKIPNIKLMRLKLCLKAYQEYLLHKKPSKAYNYPYVLLYSALRIYVEENYSKRTKEDYNLIQSRWLYSNNTSEDELLGLIMQFDVAQEYFIFGNFNIPDEFYIDETKLEDAKKTTCMKLLGQCD